MPKRLLDHDDTASLGVSLNTDGKSLNNVGKLLTALRSGKDRNATRSAIIALERWFSERLCLGDLRGATADTDDAQKKYSEWFAKHYKIFTKRLCAVVAGETADGENDDVNGDGEVDTKIDAKTRVLAFAAAMECARSEHPGRLNNELYAAVLTAAVCGRSFGEELLGALASRYLVKTDVRFHTYAVLIRYRLANAPSSSSPNDRPHTAAVSTAAYNSLLSRPGCSERAHSTAAANAKTRVLASSTSTSPFSSFASFPSEAVSPATTAQSLLVKIL